MLFFANRTNNSLSVAVFVRTGNMLRITIENKEKRAVTCSNNQQRRSRGALWTAKWTSQGFPPS